MKPKNAEKVEVSKELAEKQKRLVELAKMIGMRSTVILPRERKQETDNIQFKMEFRLKELLEQCKLNEADIKIDAMEQIIKTIDGK